MEYGEDGYYAYYTESWEACLRRLASDASHRQKIGQNMKARSSCVIAHPRRTNYFPITSII